MPTNTTKKNYSYTLFYIYTNYYKVYRGTKIKIYRYIYTFICSYAYTI